MVDGTFVGHIHLQVAQIAATERFYTGPLGMDLMLRYGPRATFMSANGYHHHIGGNTWAGENLEPAPVDAARLLWYEIQYPDKETLEAISGQLESLGYESDRENGNIRVTDPSGIQVLLTFAS